MQCFAAVLNQSVGFHVHFVIDTFATLGYDAEMDRENNRNDAIVFNSNVQKGYADYPRVSYQDNSVLLACCVTICS